MENSETKLIGLIIQSEIKHRIAKYEGKIRRYTAEHGEDHPVVIANKIRRALADQSKTLLEYWIRNDNFVI